MIERNARWALLGVLLLCAGCFSGPGTLDMMPGPTYHRAFEVREFGSAPSEEVPPRVRMLYATDREPAVEGDDEPFYANERGGELRLGEARVRLGTGVMTWEEVCERSLQKTRPSPIVMQVESVSEFGVLDRTVTAFTPPDRVPVLTGSDVDRHLFGAALVEGIHRVPERLTLYMSATDSALGLSRFLFGRDRVGVMWEDGEVDPAVAGLLLRMESLSFINVTKAERAASGNGHGYFTKSPWVSSDLLATFAFGLSPGERGLVRPSGSPVWEFPPDYADRLRAAAAAKEE